MSAEVNRDLGTLESWKRGCSMQVAVKGLKAQAAADDEDSRALEKAMAPLQARIVTLETQLEEYRNRLKVAEERIEFLGKAQTVSRPEDDIQERIQRAVERAIAPMMRAIGEQALTIQLFEEEATEQQVINLTMQKELDRLRSLESDLENVCTESYQNADFV